MSRSVLRSGYPSETRLSLLEKDQDDHDAELKLLHDALESINSRMSAILAAVSVAAVMLAINVMVGAFQR